MFDFLYTVAAFVLALGILIAVHEFGHFWVARRMGVKVLRFSIGFGKPLWTWYGKGEDRTEYVLAAIPLGGYVKMLDEREGEVPANELHRAFNRQPVARRFAVVSAGPIFNFLLALVAYWAMFVSGVPGLKPIIGDVAEGSMAARIGLEPGQQIMAVDDTKTPTWTSFYEEIVPSALRRENATITVQTRAGGERQYVLPLSSLQGEVQPQGLVQTLGLTPYQPKGPPVINQIAPGSASDSAGLKVGDRILAVDGNAMDSPDSVVEYVSQRPGQALSFRVARDGQTLTLQVTPKKTETEGKVIGRIGAGVQLDPALAEEVTGEVYYGPLRAIEQSAARTWDMSTLTLRMLGEMVVGRASVENISGPITIARYAKDSADAGFGQFLNFLAVVSLSLGVLNLLPIPVLDGGHLMYYLVEAVKGSPVSEKTEEMGQRIGIALILGLMVLAFYNDIARLAG
jgi:regulator of sigma E protease